MSLNVDTQWLCPVLQMAGLACDSGRHNHLTDSSTVFEVVYRNSDNKINIKQLTLLSKRCTSSSNVPLLHIPLHLPSLLVLKPVHNMVYIFHSWAIIHIMYLLWPGSVSCNIIYTSILVSASGLFSSLPQSVKMVTLL